MVWLPFLVALTTAFVSGVIFAHLVKYPPSEDLLSHHNWRKRHT